MIRVNDARVARVDDARALIALLSRRSGLTAREVGVALWPGPLGLNSRTDRSRGRDAHGILTRLAASGLVRIGAVVRSARSVGAMRRWGLTAAGRTAVAVGGGFWAAGARSAAAVADGYNSSTTHPHQIGDCVLAKLNLLDGEPRVNDQTIAGVVRRIAVPGGWLYQVSSRAPDLWHPPTFVPARAAPGKKRAR